MPLANAVSVGLLECRRGRVVWANRAFTELTGAGGSGPHALDGFALDALIHSSGSGVPDWAAGEHSVLPGTLVCELLRRDGERREVSVRSLGAGRFEVCDLSDRHRVEREVHRLAAGLRAANAELESLRERLLRETREREDLLSVVSHELKTPLTVVAGFTRLLLSEEAGPLTEEQRKFLGESARSCERLTAFVNHLVDSSQEIRDGWPVDLREADVESTLRSVTDLLAPIAKERGQRIELAVSPETERALFDPPRIEQVLTNLVGNALKYGDPHSVIKVETRRLAAAGLAFIEVAVEDQGPGVPVFERERIFEPYVRGSQQGDGAGLGLGLAICRRIVTAHGGTIAVDSVNGGCRVAFTLPADRSAA